MISSAQIRAARVLINLSQDELARAAGVSVPTLKRCESDLETAAPVSPSTRTKITAALEAAGVEFIAENGGGAGVRLRKN